MGCRFLPVWLLLGTVNKYIIVFVALIPLFVSEYPYVYLVARTPIYSEQNLNIMTSCPFFGKFLPQKTNMLFPTSSHLSLPSLQHLPKLASGPSSPLRSPQHCQRRRRHSWHWSPAPSRRGPWRSGTSQVTAMGGISWEYSVIHTEYKPETPIIQMFVIIIRVVHSVYMG